VSRWSRYRVRVAERSELLLLAAIEKAAAVRFSEIGKYDSVSVTTPVEVLEARQAAGRLWVAVGAADRPVGFAFVTVLDGNAHLEELNVLPAHGRRGLGTMLTVHVCRWAIRRGLPAVALSTYRSVPWNMPFYRRIGFQELSEYRWTPGIERLRRAEERAGLDVSDRLFMVRSCREKSSLPMAFSCANLGSRL